MTETQTTENNHDNADSGPRVDTLPQPNAQVERTIGSIRNVTSENVGNLINTAETSNRTVNNNKPEIVNMHHRSKTF